MSDKPSSGPAKSTGENVPAPAPTPDGLPPEIRELLEKKLFSVLRASGAKPEKVDTAVEIAVETTIQTISKYHAGPLPPAEELDAYERACPNAARDIVDMAISAQRHRQAWDRREQMFDFVLGLSGYVVGAGAIGAMLYCGYALAVAGYPVLAGVVFGGTGIATVGSAFLRSFVFRQDSDAKEKPKPKPPAKRGRGR